MTHITNTRGHDYAVEHGPRQRKAALVRVWPAFLAELMHMPDGMEITGVDWDRVNNELRVFVEGPSLPAVPEGYPLPSIQPAITQHYGGEGHVTETWDWTVRE